MNDIFVSYSHNDKKIIRPLVSLLESLGYSVWWDTSLFVGSAFSEEIEEELNNSKCVIVVWSKYSIKSRWVRAEANLAMKNNTLLPVTLGNVNVPLPFDQFHTSDISSITKNDFLPQEIVKSIEKYTDKGSVHNQQYISKKLNTRKFLICTVAIILLSSILYGFFVKLQAPNINDGIRKVVDKAMPEKLNNKVSNEVAYHLSSFEAEKSVNENYEKILKKIHLDSDRSYIYSFFGLPVKTKEIGVDYFEEMYQFDMFYLQIIYKKSKVEFYAITSRSSKFKFDMMDGKRTFYDINPREINFVDSNKSEPNFLLLYLINSMNGRLGTLYAEMTYGLNPPQYYYYGYTSQGYPYNKESMGYFGDENLEGGDYEEPEKNIKKIIQEYRSGEVPNTIGYGTLEFRENFKWGGRWEHLVGTDYMLMGGIYDSDPVSKNGYDEGK